MELTAGKVAPNPAGVLEEIYLLGGQPYAPSPTGFTRLRLELAWKKAGK
jgi:hypothetical protein